MQAAWTLGGAGGAQPAPVCLRRVTLTLAYNPNPNPNQVRSLRLCAEDEFVLLASDGLWDVVDSATAVAAAREELRAYGETAPYTHTPPQPAAWP